MLLFENKKEDYQNESIICKIHKRQMRYISFDKYYHYMYCEKCYPAHLPQERFFDVTDEYDIKHLKNIARYINYLCKQVEKGKFEE